MIPSILSQPEDNAKTPNTVAYVSVQDEKALGNHPKALRGQIRKCNLTNSRMGGKLILKEVKLDSYFAAISVQRTVKLLLVELLM